MTSYTVHAELCRATRTMVASGRGSSWPVAASTCHAVAPGASRSLCGKLSTPWTQVADDWAIHDAGPQRGLLCRKCRAVLVAMGADCAERADALGGSHERGGRAY